MEIIYADSLFLSNLLADYLLCLCAARLCALPLRRGRYFMAALLGAAYSVLVFLPGFGFLAGPVWKAVFGGAMLLIAYAGQRRALPCAGVFLALSAALGGALWALELNFGYIRLDLRLLTVCFLLAYGALRLIFSAVPGASGHGTRLLEIHMSGRSCRLSAMVDSGNCLSEPHQRRCGGGGLSSGPEGALRLCRTPAGYNRSGGAAPLRRSLPGAYGAAAAHPLSALGGGGLLPVFKPDKLLIDGREDRDRLVALSAKAAGSGYDGII